MSDEDTSIRIKRETWRQLRDRKGPGDSFDQVISEMLDDAGDAELVGERTNNTPDEGGN